MCIRDSYEVLERVKELFLLPDTDLMSINQVAEYYEVSPQWIKDLYIQNKNEIDSDGTKMIKRNHYDGSLLKTTSVEKKQTSVKYIFDDGQVVTINNRGLKAFSRDVYKRQY